VQPIATDVARSDFAADELMYAFQGTVIRVFSVPDGQKLFEFRRGVKRYAPILDSLLFCNIGFSFADNCLQIICCKLVICKLVVVRITG